MEITTPLAAELGSYLDLSALQLKVTAQNMANIDTPGYRTAGFDFVDAMQRSVVQLERRWERQRLQGASVPETDGAAAADGAPGGAGKVSLRPVDGLLERPDGNNVSVDREGLKMAEAQLQFRTGMELLKREFTRVLDAIHVDQK
jgi:flagellar basal-body rod protein FlgB